MGDQNQYEAKREELTRRYLDDPPTEANGAGTGGVDHLVLISSDIERTIEFYRDVLGMKLTRLIQNRDDPTSTHIFLDMGGGNLLAFFDFPEHGTAPTVRGIGAMHHVALKATNEQYQAVVGNLESREIEHSIHGTKEKGSVYFRDPDNILLEIRTEYRAAD